ncbi:nucleoside hydrolase [Erwinia sp. JUb26]|uniref:nucleoside hydrolase n=1 Tax=Erwinia sp. JUb26 TaxID=2485126 RepID=UPI000F46D9F8|nr:nucleoside hydrolase [Erwinia sp. JUb26]ROR08774.1 inosine-uridine nucleoside N-ribohydrolase [Erwinia sp. JUb26]
MQKIIFDTDIGVDDAFALAYAAKSTDILGITTVFGNVSVEQAVKNARLFSQKIGLNVPIYRGSSRPLACAPTPPALQVHGKDGLGGVFDNPCSGEADNAIHFIINRVRQHPGEITLVAIGPLTNIAAAINQAPDIVAKVAQLVIMGGAFGTLGHGGNVTPFAEFNIWKDPHAADQVLSSQLKIVVLPLDVTHQVQISGEDIRSLNRPELEAISRSYLQYSLEKEGFEGMALHDTLTIAWLNHPELFGITQSPVRVVTEGISRGQTLRRLHPLASRDDPFAAAGIQKLCLAVDSERVKAHFLVALRD